jgi:hypothetical protein
MKLLSLRVLVEWLDERAGRELVLRHGVWGGGFCDGGERAEGFVEDGVFDEVGLG